LSTEEEVELRTVLLTGTMGAGKSTVASMLAERGATVIDTDQVAREVVEPGSIGLTRIASTFGAKFIDAEGRLDRAALAAEVFADPSATERLNALIHPLVHESVRSRLRALESDPTVSVVVIEVPVFRPQTKEIYQPDLTVLVRCSDETALRRLVETRGFRREDAERRLARQMSAAERSSYADVVIDNDGDRAALDEAVSALWRRLDDVTTAP
jgi:dephospho-CoA kinase